MDHLLPVRPEPEPAAQPWSASQKDLELTHRAFGGDGHRLQQDLDDPGSDPRHVLAVCVQVVQDLLDHMVRVLRLSPSQKHEVGSRYLQTNRLFLQKLQQVLTQNLQTSTPYEFTHNALVQALRCF